MLAMFYLLYWQQKPVDAKNVDISDGYYNFIFNKCKLGMYQYRRWLAAFIVILKYWMY